MLRTSVAIGLLGAIFVTALLGGYHLHALNGDRAVQQFQEVEHSMAEKLSALLQSELVGASRTLQAIAHGLPPSQDPGFLDQAMRQQNQCGDNLCFSALGLFGPDGIPRRASGQPIDLTKAELAASVAWMRNPPLAENVRVVITSPRPPSLVLLTLVPTMQPQDRGTKGMIAAQMSLDALFASRQGAPESGWPQYETLVLKRDGTVVFHSQHPEMRFNNVYRRTDRCFTCHQSFDHVERMLAMRHGVLQYNVRGKDYLAAIAPLTFAGEEWIVGVKVPRHAATGLLSAEVRYLAGISTLFIGLVIAAGAFIWRDGNRRTRAEAEAAQKVHLERSHVELTTLNAQLERAAHEWRTTVDMIDAALIVLEPSGSILRMNLTAAATLPGGLAAWLGQPSARLIEQQPWVEALKLASDALDREVATIGRLREAPGGRTWDLGCRVLPHQPRSTVLILARDVTEVVELQESVQRSETMATLGSLVVGVAHEVRNPLFAISALVDAWAVQSHRDPTPFVDALRSEVNRLRTLMVELLEYGKPPKFTWQVLGVRDVIDGAVRACAHESAARRVRVSVAASSDVDVLMDPRRMERVFINLIQNAIQHAPADSAVLVEIAVPAASDQSKVAITIRDRGRGFALDDLPRVFKPFFSRRPGGFGLGLAITERIVGEHQGKVAAANDPCGGAVITVWLPLTHTRPAAAGQEETSSCSKAAF